MNTDEQEIARNHARAMDIGRRMSGTDAAVATAMISTKSGLFGVRRKHGTVVAALGSGVLRLQRVEPVMLEPDGPVIELSEQNLKSITSKNIELPAAKGVILCSGSTVAAKTVDGALYELSFLDGTGDLFRDHSPETCADVKRAYDAVMAWIPSVSSAP
jgi:hypothetical protein